MDKVKSKFKETRCTCITDLVKGQNKKQHRPTGAGALSRSGLRLKSIVVRVENRVQCESRNLPTGIEANATGHTRLKFPVKSRHHVVKSRAKGYRKPKTKIKIEIKSQFRPTKVELRFENSVETRLKSKSRYSLEAGSFDA